MTVEVLLKLLKEDQWEARHGGLLGIKYALAVRQVQVYLFCEEQQRLTRSSAELHVCSSVSQDLISVLLPRVLPAVTTGLQDLDDDVRAVAASALIPVVEGLVQLLPTKVREAVSSVTCHHLPSLVFVLTQRCVFQVPFIVNTLWDALLDLDDLTASTNSIMTLLSSLLTYPQVRQCRLVCREIA